VQISDKAICTAFETIEQARGNTSLTYFEFSTLAALIMWRGKLSNFDICLLIDVINKSNG
jgi:dihydrofolate synthase/folylpolyglutamate synthase